MLRILILFKNWANKGDNSIWDTLVKDLYGSSYGGLDGETIASSFGKIASISADELATK